MSIWSKISQNALHFSNELTSCGHWWLAWGKLNATWHLVYKLFYWAVVETDWAITEAWDVHSCLFDITTSRKEEGMIALTCALCSCSNWGIYTAICGTTSKSVKMAFIVWISWINGHNLKNETLFLIKSNKIYCKTVNFQSSSTRALVKTMLYLFGTHA